MNDENKYEPYQYGMPEEPENGESVEEEVEVEITVEEETPVESSQQYSYSYNYDIPQPQTEQSTPKKNKKSFLKVAVILALAVVFGVVVAVVFKGTTYIMDRYFGEPITESRGDTNTDTNTSIESTQIITGTGTTVNSTIADVAENVMPSVVSITSMSIQEVQNFPFGGVTEYEVPSTGSGIIIGQNSSEVLIVTNNHVVEDSKTLTVVWIDGSSTEAQIRGTDSDMDLAIIAVPMSSLEDTTLEAIKVATLGDSDALRVGEPTIAIGNALGYGQSVTVGIVSALNRTLDGIDGELIQTDAAINPGNSGGALLNANGEVIGINTAKVSDSAVEGMGYAIPISDVADVLETLVNQEVREKVPESERGSLGIYGVDVGADVASWYSIPAGVYVKSLVKGGGAANAKLPIYSIITEINGEDVENLEELTEELAYYKKGETVTVTCYVQATDQYVEKEYKITLN